MGKLSQLISVEGVCCQYCEHFEQDSCPVKNASPWSRWGNWCNHFSGTGEVTVIYQDANNRERGIVGCSASEHIVPDDDDTEQEYRAQEQELDAMRQTGASE